VAALYSPRSGFDSSSPSTCVWSQPVRQFEGLADGGACATQGPAWRRSIRTRIHNVEDGPTVLGMGAQGWGWPHMVGSGGEDVLCLPCVTAPSWMSIGLVVVCSSRASLSLFEGCVMEEGRGAGGTSLGNDTSHPAQHPHNNGDGCILVGCSNSARAGFPSCVSRSTWRGFAFDPGTRGMSEHLMPRSGEQVRHCGLREALSEAETRLGG
jgi:hypothetical protein